MNRHMCPPLHFYACAGWGRILGLFSRSEPVWCGNVMVVAQTPHGVHSASIRNVYKVFWHIDMPRIDTWVPPYIVRPVKVRSGLDWQGFWVDKRARVMSWCHGWGSNPLWNAFHIHMICIQSVLASLHAGDSHVGPPLHSDTSLQVGGGFWGNRRVDPSPCNVVM
jgi:hypothetical protein